MNRIRKSIKENFISFGILMIVILMAFSAVSGWYNKQQMLKTTETKRSVEELRNRISSIVDDYMTHMDLGLRGYALTRNEQMLVPYENSISAYNSNLRKIDSLLILHHLDTSRIAFSKVASGVRSYVQHSENMKKLASEGKMEAFLKLLDEDRGFHFWQMASPFFQSHQEYANAQIEKAEKAYEQAMNNNILIQIFLVILGLPILGMVVFRLKKEAQGQKELLLKLAHNNRKYVFHPGTALQDTHHDTVIDRSIINFQKAASFVKDITQGNYEVTWDGLNKENESLNTQNLVGELMVMRNKMKEIKVEADKRNWNNEGLARFSEIVRNHQNNLQTLSDESVRFLSKYLKAQQGSLFILQQDEQEAPFLQLTSCFAFDKKKYVENKIPLGHGLVGQTYLERQPTILNQIPQGYMSITSGLGDATPNHLAIIPLQYNDEVTAVIEIASFYPIEEYQISFLEKAGEFFASTVTMAKNAEQTEVLLQQSKEQMEQLRAQEEELRQNMEELMATQESFRRESASDLTKEL